MSSKLLPAALSVLCLLQVAAATNPVRFEVPSQPASQAILQAAEQAGVEVLFPFDELSRRQSTAIEGVLEPRQAFERILAGAGFTVRESAGNRFVILPALQPAGSIRGRVLTPEGRPAHGIRVRVSGSSQFVMTDDNGAFLLISVPAGNHTLEINDEIYRPLRITDVRVIADRPIRLRTVRLQPLDEITRLEPYIIVGRWSVDRGRGEFAPRTAAGNLDLHRTEDDPLPYAIYDRESIIRSGVVNLNEFLQRELLDSDAATRPPEQNGSLDSFIAGSTNLNLRGYGADHTVVLVNGRRLPESLPTGSGILGPPDVNFIPLSLVGRIEVLPVSASALYGGNAVGGVINIVLRPDVDATEVNTTYTNALGGFDAPQASFALLHGRTLLDGALRIRLSAAFTRMIPPTEAELGYRRDGIPPPASPGDPIFGATPNIRSVDDAPLFGPGSASTTSVSPGSNGAGGLAAFSGREGLPNLDLFKSPGGMAAAPGSIDFPYGRRQRRDAYYASAEYDVFPHLQLGLDVLHARTVVNRGYDVFAADLKLDADSPFNPFGQDVFVSLNETAPNLGERYSEARLEFSSAVLGLLLDLPREWKVSADAQVARNIAKYRGIAGADPERWQELVDQGLYNPLRDTQVHGPPALFYEQVATYYGTPGRFVSIGDYSTFDGAVRFTNESFPWPTGGGAMNLGGDYRINHLKDHNENLHYGDGSPVGESPLWEGRTLEQVSFFGELQAPLLPSHRLPDALRGVEINLAGRYVTADNSREAHLAPAGGLKLDFNGGFSIRGSITKSNRFPSPHMRRPLSAPSLSPGGETEHVQIFDPIRNQSYPTLATVAFNPDLRLEAAVTRTAGLVFQRGYNHPLRVAVDFVDTRKVNEIVFLESQMVMNLEDLWPERVERGPPGTGPALSILTGNMNLAWRHSRNWNTSVDYTRNGVLGGALQLHGRWVYFQRYEGQVFPDSPIVDELRLPGGTAAGLLKHRARFGAGWSNRHFGFGMDGHYFHHRILPAVEWAGQGRDRIDPFRQFDVHFQVDLGLWLPWDDARRGLHLQTRVNNVFASAFPAYANHSSGAGVQPYGDWRGRTYSLSLTATF